MVIILWGGWNYRAIDFDGAFSSISEVVSLKTYHPKRKNFVDINKTISEYAKKLNSATLDPKYLNHSKILDFVVQKGEWDNLMDDIKLAIQNMMQNDYPDITIRLIEI